MKEFLIEIIDKLLWFILPYYRGELLFQLHYWGFLGLTGATILYGQRKHVAYYLWFLILVLLLFRTYNGCLLTQLERHYRQVDETIVDGFLRMIGIPISKDSRISITLGGLILIFVFMVLYYVRLVSTGFP